MHFFEGIGLGQSTDYYEQCEVRKETKEKKLNTRRDSSPQPLKFLLPKCVLYCYATTAAQSVRYYYKTGESSREVK